MTTRVETGRNPSLCLWFLIATAGAYAESFTGKVVGVTDGDSLSILHNGRAEPVRLNGIDAPERGQPYANVAKKHLSDLVFGKTVRVEVQSKDRYQRTVADVFIDGVSINREMVRAGLAWWFRRYAPRDEWLRDLEEEAREAHRGLWQDKDPVPPWDFRRRPKRTP